VILRWGNTQPEFLTAARTRSLASWTAASGSPTMLKAGSPGSTSTSTIAPSRPTTAPVCVFARSRAALRLLSRLVVSERVLDHLLERQRLPLGPDCIGSPGIECLPCSLQPGVALPSPDGRRDVPDLVATPGRRSAEPERSVGLDSELGKPSQALDEGRDAPVVAQLSAKIQALAEVLLGILAGKQAQFAQGQTNLVSIAHLRPQRSRRSQRVLSGWSGSVWPALAPVMVARLASAWMPRDPSLAQGSARTAERRAIPSQQGPRLAPPALC
jgi:hypothetical protein